MGMAFTLTLYPLLLAMYLYRNLLSLLLATLLLIYDQNFHIFHLNDWANSKWKYRNHDIESSSSNIEGIADRYRNNPSNKTRDEVFKFLIDDHY